MPDEQPTMATVVIAAMSLICFIFAMCFLIQIKHIQQQQSFPLEPAARSQCQK